MIIQDAMNKVLVVSPDITLKKAAKIFSKNKIGSLVVVKGEKPVYLITERDIIKNISHLKKKVSQIKHRKLITVKENQDLSHAAELMYQHKIKRLPVLSKNNKLVGIITATDLIANSDFLGADFF